MKIILASSSPRRKELLTLMGLEFEIIKPENDEDMTQKVNFRRLSEILSLQKAEEVFNKTSGDRVVIGSDCMVYINKTLLGKPKSKIEAFVAATSDNGFNLNEVLNPGELQLEDLCKELGTMEEDA